MTTTVQVVFTDETARALAEKAGALGMTSAQLVAQLVALDVCDPDTKDEQMRACREANTERHAPSGAR